MSQNDFTLANQGFPSMRTDMNSAFQALASNNSGGTAPTTTFAHQWWYDTTNSLLMIRNAGNTAFEEFSAGGGGIVYVEKTANYTAAAGEGIIADTSSGSWTLTLPATPASGDVVVIADGADWATNNLTVGRNGNTIEGDSSNLILNIGGVSVTFIYASNNWQIYTQMGAASGTVVVEGSSPTFARLILDATNPQITSSDADGFLSISGDSNASTGTNIRIFSASHAGNANNIIFRNGGTATLKYDSTATSWNFQANDLSTTGTMTATDFVGDGSALTGLSSGGFQFIASVDLSNDATVEFTGFDATKYDGYEFLLGNVIGTVETSLAFRTSSNGGVSYDSGASDYQLLSSAYNMGFATSGIGNAAGEEGACGTVVMATPHLPKRTILVTTYGTEDSAGKLENAVRASSRLSSAAVNAIQFLMYSGNLTSGTITMYGKVNS